jgi:hypothetical protein
MLAEVEAYVADKLFAKLEAEPGFAAALAEDQHAEARAGLAGKLAAIRVEREEYGRQAGRGDISGAEWLAYRQGLAEREAGLNRDLAAIPAPPKGGKDWQEIRAMWDDPDALELDERRAFLRRYIARVTILRARPGTKGFDPGRVQLGDDDWAEP